MLYPIYFLYKNFICYNSETLEKKISCLETENIKMREEFNMQRAKMKELFLQKEGMLRNNFQEQ